MEEFTLEPGEVVITRARQHGFVLFLQLVPFALLALVPLLVAPLFDLFAAATANGAALALQPLGAHFRFFLGLWWLFLWMGAFSVITRHFLTVWVITSQRIVDIDQHSFFSRTVSSFLLMRVQDVTTDVHGIFATLIGYGTLNVETAGSMEKFRMPGVKHPEHLRDLIMREVAELHAADAPVATAV